MWIFLVTVKKIQLFPPPNSSKYSNDLINFEEAKVIEKALSKFGLLCAFNLLIDDGEELHKEFI